MRLPSERPLRDAADPPKVVGEGIGLRRVDRPAELRVHMMIGLEVERVRDVGSEQIHILVVAP